MINHGKVRSTIKPEKMVIDEYSVWISENINKIEVESENSDSNEKTVMYQYDLIQYTKDEYIAMQSNQMTDVEMALVEIYESLGV